MLYHPTIFQVTEKSVSLFSLFLFVFITKTAQCTFLLREKHRKFKEKMTYSKVFKKPPKKLISWEKRRFENVELSSCEGKVKKLLEIDICMSKKRQKNKSKNVKKNRREMSKKCKEMSKEMS